MAAAARRVLASVLASIQSVGAILAILLKVCILVSRGVEGRVAVFSRLFMCSMLSEFQVSNPMVRSMRMPAAMRFAVVCLSQHFLVP